MSEIKEVKEIIEKTLDKIEGDSVSKDELSKILQEILPPYFDFRTRTFVN